MKAEEQLYAICPKVGASLSFIGGLFIIHGFYTGAGALRKKVFHRLACSMALFMTILSLSLFLGTWPIPKDTMMYAYGNHSSCQIQGTIIVYCNGVVWGYFTSLSLLALIQVRNDFNETKTRKVELWFHFAILFLPIPSVVIALFRGFINPGKAWCWVETYPISCTQDPAVECIRGGNMAVYLRGISLLYLAMFIFSVFFLLLIIASIYRSASREKDLTGLKQFMEQAKKRKLKMVMRQYTLFLVILIFGAAPLFLSKLVRTITKKDTNMILDLVCMSVYPAIGFFFSIVYHLLRIERKKNDSTKRLFGSTCEYMTQIEQPCILTKKKESFSIFDGTSYSGKWAAFIYESDEESRKESESRIVLGLSDVQDDEV